MMTFFKKIIECSSVRSCIFAFQKNIILSMFEDTKRKGERTK